jgi:hypothetical protein
VSAVLLAAAAVVSAVLIRASRDHLQPDAQLAEPMMLAGGLAAEPVVAG